MSWINTGRIVATRAIVKDHHAFGNRTEVKNPANPVSRFLFSLRKRIQLTIAMRVFFAHPEPARSRGPNLGKEPFWGEWRKSLRLQVLGRNLCHRLVICPVGLLAHRAFLISLILALPASLFSQGFTYRRPFVLTSVTVSNQTPEQLASYGLALRWVASDLGTNSLNVNTWTDRVQGAIWRNDDSGGQPGYTTNNGLSFDLTHFLTNNSFGPYFNTCCNCCAFGFIMDITKIGDFASYVYPPLICNSLKGIPSGGGAGGASLAWQFDNANYNATHGFPLLFWGGSTEGGLTNAYPITNVWHDLIAGNYYTNAVAWDWIYQITNGVLWYSNNVAGALSESGWGMPYDVSIGYSNFPTSLGHNWYRQSGPLFYLKELWIWTNNYFPVGPVRPSIYTNFHIYATNTYGYTP